MLAVFVTFQFTDHFSAADLHGLARQSAGRFEGLPGLRSKLFTVSPERQEARNIYVWDDAEAARRFFTPELLAHVAGLYGVRPLVEFAEVGALVENPRG